jgi:hypothetical protein
MMMRVLFAERRAAHAHHLSHQLAQPLQQLVVGRIDVNAIGLVDLVVFVVAVEAGRRGEPKNVGLLLKSIGRDRRDDGRKTAFGDLIFGVGLEAIGVSCRA